jgi:hypothetical protein
LGNSIRFQLKLRKCATEIQQYRYSKSSLAKLKSSFAMSEIQLHRV